MNASINDIGIIFYQNVPLNVYIQYLVSEFTFQDHVPMQMVSFKV